MSRAFVREADAEANDALPDRPISPHPNFVTAAGLAQMEARLRELEAARTAALEGADAQALGAIERDLRYWRQRRGSARLVAPPATPEIVRFGVTVQLRFDDGTERLFRIVGEDEADPAAGRVSWTSPVGAALIGRRRGEDLQLLGRSAEIIGLSA